MPCETIASFRTGKLAQRVGERRDALQHVRQVFAGGRPVMERVERPRAAHSSGYRAAISSIVSPSHAPQWRSTSRSS